MADLTQNDTFTYFELFMENDVWNKTFICNKSLRQESLHEDILYNRGTSANNLEEVIYLLNRDQCISEETGTKYFVKQVNIDLKEYDFTIIVMNSMEKMIQSLNEFNKIKYKQFVSEHLMENLCFIVSDGQIYNKNHNVSDNALNKCSRCLYDEINECLSDRKLPVNNFLLIKGNFVFDEMDMLRYGSGETLKEERTLYFRKPMFLLDSLKDISNKKMKKMHCYIYSS